MVNSAALERPRKMYDESVLANGTPAPKLTHLGSKARRAWTEVQWHLMIEEKELRERYGDYPMIPRPILTKRGQEARERWLYRQ